MFSANTTPEKFENATITGHLGFVFGENPGWETSKCRRFRKAQILECFPSPEEYAKPALSSSYGLKSVFGKIYFLTD